MSDQLEKEFNDFCQEDTVKVPAVISDSILNRVRRDLNATWPVVVGKLLCIQSIVGVLTLLFCPQFDLSLTSNYSLFHFFHRNFGPYTCMAICGVIFIGSGSLVAFSILKVSELQMIKMSKYLLSLSMSGIAVFVFILLGAEVYFNMVLIWVTAASLSSILLLEGLSFFRYRLIV